MIFKTRAVRLLSSGLDADLETGISKQRAEPQPTTDLIWKYVKKASNIDTNDRLLFGWTCRIVIFVLRKKGSKTKKRIKKEKIEKGDCGPPTRKDFFFEILSALSDLSHIHQNYLSLYKISQCWSEATLSVMHHGYICIKYHRSFWKTSPDVLYAEVLF